MVGFTTFGQFVQPPSRFDIAPQQQYQNAQIQRQLNEIAAQKAAAQAAAKTAEWEAFRDSETAKLANERDEAIKHLRAKYNPTIAELESQAAIPSQKIKQLEQKSKDLEALKLASVANNNARRKALLKQRATQSFQPKDPWRSLDGKIYNAKDTNWYQFSGQVLEIKSDGILIAGTFGPPLESGFGTRNFFVEHFPNETYSLADNEEITKSMNFVAHMGGKTIYQFTHSKIALGVETVRRLDYGKVVTSPPDELIKKWENQSVIDVHVDGADPEILKEIEDNQNEQLKTAKEFSEIGQKVSQVKSNLESEIAPLIVEYQAKVNDLPNVYAKQLKDNEEAKRKSVQNNALKLYQDLADKGDPIGLLRMGEAYRDGKGVPKDLAKARDYLTKAAAAGSPTAADELKRLPAD